MLGIWADVTQASINGWGVLSQIINAFLPDAFLPKSLATLKRYRRHLDLLPVKKVAVTLLADKVSCR